MNVKVSFLFRFVFISIFFINCKTKRVIIKERVFEEKNKKIEKQILQKKNYLVILTRSVGASLGDVSASAKLITLIQKSLLVDVVLIIENKSFDHYEMIPEGVLIKKISNWNEIKDGLLKNIVKESKLNIAFPTFHHMSASIHRYLAEIPPQFLKFSEYDQNLKEDDPVFENVVKTGLCDDCLGIFLDDSREIEDPISAIPKSDKFLQVFLKDEENQSDRSYFGYFAKYWHDQNKKTWNHQVDYITLVLLYELLSESKSTYSINLFVPSVLEQFEAVIKELKKSETEEPFKSLLENVRLEYFNFKEGLEVTSSHNFGGNQEKVFRIVNPYPLNHKSMMIMNQLSSYFVGSTGDQSLSESLQFGKVPYYQALPHKQKLFRNFVNMIKTRVKGSESLVSFYESSFSHIPPTLAEQLDKAKKLKEHAKLWKEQMSELREYLMKEKKLDANIVAYIENKLK